MKHLLMLLILSSVKYNKIFILLNNDATTVSANTTQVRFEPRNCNTALPIVDISFFYILDMIRTQSLKENYYHLLSPVKCMLNPHTSLEMSVYSMTSWQIVVVTIGTID